MIDNFVSLVSSTFYSGGEIGNMLRAWEQAGFFTYLIPFLLIFAIVFVIISRIKAFEDNKAVSAIIAVSVGLMALQFEFVSIFFAEIFPRLGVGLAIILCLLIMIGLFLDPGEKGLMWTLFGVGALIFIIALYQTAGSLGWSSGYWWQQNWELVVGGIFILVLVAIIVGAGSNNDKTPYRGIGFFDPKIK